MKHFKVAHHKIAVASIGAIVISLGLAATATGQAVNSIMLNNDKTTDFGMLFTDAIDNIVQARTAVEQTFAEFRKDDGGATEAKDVDHVIDSLVEAGYVQQDSQAVSLMLQKGLDAAFSRLDILADMAVDRLTSARDNMPVDNTDSYLGYTMPAQKAIDDMMQFARELQIIVSATWRDHNNQPSFVVATTGPLTEAKRVVAA